MSASYPPDSNGNGHEPTESQTELADDESHPGRHTAEYLTHTVVELRREVAALRTRVDAQAATIAGLSQAVMTLTNAVAEFNAGLVSLRNDASVMATAASAARFEAQEAATDARAARERLDEERRAAYRAGSEGQPLDSVPVPAERQTDPDLHRYSSMRPPAPEDVPSE